MAYQNVGTPRFYINVIEWLDSSGYINFISGWNTLPVDVSNSWTSFDLTPYNIGSFFKEGTSTKYPNGQNFLALLGHTCVTDGGDVWIHPYTDAIWTEVVNMNPYHGYNNSGSGYNGFTIMIHNVVPSSLPMSYYDTSNNSWPAAELHIGSLVLGTFYDMPHSPDLKLTMTREMDGVKRVRTKGGNDLIDHKYTKPAPWGVLGAWELGGSPKLSRSGRRIWDLSFSQLQDGDMFPEVSNITTHEASTPEGYTYPSYSDYGTNPYEWGLLQQNGWGNNNFYGEVIHRTNGGQLPFIFQPDSSNNNPDGFAICKFDMNTFKFEQVANGVYNIKVKIREVW